jgi:Sulfotransferase family
VVRGTRFWKARRLVWRVRRSVPRAAQPLSLVVKADAPRRPIFVIGCPRSGTTLLLQALLQSPELRSVHSEGHILWDAYHHPRERGWESDALGAEDVLPREREYIYLALRLWTRGRRFVDKTPESCLRIPYLEALFPDARYVFLRRRAADNVNSLMEGWRARPRFVKYRLPSGHRWSFVLVPGWRELVGTPLEEVCARQYVACNEAVLDAREAIEPSRWHELSYEELVAAPTEALRSVFESLDLPVPREADRAARTPTRTTLTAPRPEKWREQNPEAIERILPLVRPVEARLGYEPS